MYNSGMHKNIQDKIEKRIDKSGECWVWIGYIHKKDGYGRYRLPNMKWDKTAHRVVYELYNDIEIDSDMTIDHLCLNKKCVNPKHLEVVSRSENSRRARLVDTDSTKMKRIKAGFRGGYNGDYCKRGHRLEDISWSNGQRRLCRQCHREYNRNRAKNIKLARA